MFKGAEEEVAAEEEEEAHAKMIIPKLQCYRCGQYGHTKVSCNTDLSQYQCHNCGKYGHIKTNCWLQTKDNERGISKFMHKEEKDEDVTLFMVCSAQEATMEAHFDSGCSNHMTGNKDVFVNLDESIQTEIKIGDDKRLKVKGRGDVLVKTNKGNKRITKCFIFQTSNTIF